jgi:hypothetical protein
MENSFPPEKTSVAYPGSGIYVMRNVWDIADCTRFSLSLDEESRQRQLIINSKTGEMCISAFNRVLLNCREQNKYEAVKWENNEKQTSLFMKSKDSEEEIVYVKPNYWTFKIKGKGEVLKEFELNGEEIIEDENRIRTKNFDRKVSSGQTGVEMRHLGELQIIPVVSKMSLNENNKVILSGAYSISFVIYPFIDIGEKCSYERIDKNYVPRKTDEIIYVIGDKGYHIEKKISYVPKIKVKENEDGGLEIDREY